MKDVACFGLFSEEVAERDEGREFFLPANIYQRCFEIGNADPPKGYGTLRVEVGSAEFDQVLELLRLNNVPIVARGEGPIGPLVKVGRQVEFESADYETSEYFVIHPEKHRISLVSEDFRMGQLKSKGKPSKSVVLGGHDRNINDCIAGPSFKGKVVEAGFRGVVWEELPVKGGGLGVEASFLMNAERLLPAILGGYMGEDGIPTSDYRSLPGRCLPASGHSPDVYVYDDDAFDGIESDFLRSLETFGRAVEKRTRISIFSKAFAGFLREQKIAFEHFPVLFASDVPATFFRPVRELIK